MNILSRIRHNSNTLFTRLLASFLVIVLLLLGFNFLLLTYFKTVLHEEIIRNNQQNVKKTMANYEKSFKDIANTLTFTMTLEKDVKELYQSPAIDYRLADTVLKKLQSDLLNHSFANVDNVFLHFRRLGLTIEKGGLSDPETMFSRYIASAAYPESFWEEQLQQSFNYKIYPAAMFNRTSGDGTTGSRVLIPILVKQQVYKQLYAVAFVQAPQLQASSHETLDSELIILNHRQEVLYASDDVLAASLPALDDLSGYVQLNDNYYFYQYAPETGLTYIDIVPYKNMAQKVQQLEFWLAVVFILAIALSIGASIWFSFRFYSPIKRIVEDIKPLGVPLNADEGQLSKVKEFELINRNFQHMMQEHQHISKHIEDQHSLLRKYALIDKLKQIYFNAEPLREIQFTDRPYVLAIFDFAFKPAFTEEIELNEARAAAYLRELIQVMAAAKFPESLIFQIQDRQIASLVFADPSDAAEHTELAALLHTLSQIFDRDMKYCAVTIALSSPYSSSSELSRAYEQAQARVKQRRLGSATQLLSEDYVPVTPFILTPNREQELLAQMQAGNEKGMNQCVEKILAELQRKDAYISQFNDILYSMLCKLQDTLVSSQLDADMLKPIIAQLPHCYEFQQFVSIWRDASSLAAKEISKRQEIEDPITSFVMSYIETNYHEDIYLDALADKLQITPGYLSTYFKEKTGMNFSEYLNMFRIEKAKQMLHKTDIPVVEIGRKVGYPSTNSFFRMFKKLIGHTPGNYRKLEKK
ncbi:helix-turn-helix transcriptional regulator [Paenibacillus sp. GCM10027626]|uniref:helix-turn-helix transcriptional regulator n=1 Tax=Paenibacillus sp. GCM10027626 TaxID=3273411 RepID=UPI003624B191